MNTLATDPKPWMCTNCSDRFVHDVTSNMIHWTVFSPRSLYSQSVEDYR